MIYRFNTQRHYNYNYDYSIYYYYPTDAKKSDYALRSRAFRPRDDIHVVAK